MCSFSRPHEGHELVCPWFSRHWWQKMCSHGHITIIVTGIVLHKRQWKYVSSTFLTLATCGIRFPPQMEKLVKISLLLSIVLKLYVRYSRASSCRDLSPSIIRRSISSSFRMFSCSSRLSRFCYRSILTFMVESCSIVSLCRSFSSFTAFFYFSILFSSFSISLSFSTNCCLLMVIWVSKSLLLSIRSPTLYRSSFSKLSSYYATFSSFFAHRLETLSCYSFSFRRSFVDPVKASDVYSSLYFNISFAVVSFFSFFSVDSRLFRSSLISTNALCFSAFIFSICSSYWPRISRIKSSAFPYS